MAEKGMDYWVSTLSRVLYIDLTKKVFWVENREDLFSKWLGGIGVATQLYKEEVPKDADPLSPQNAVIFAIGPFSATFPFGSKTVAVFKSPLNGYFAESHAGGRSAAAMRAAGYGAIVIRGASDRPIYLVIDEGKVRFRDAAILWGMRSIVTVGRILREVTPNPGRRAIMRIGRAGERLVRYANVTTETFRHFGRMGLGAVFGSKKLKAVVITGGKGYKVPNIAEYRKVYREILDLATKSELMKKYHDLGTPANIVPLNKIGALPTRNFSSGSFEQAEEISGERLAETMLARRVACAACPTACIHIAALREEYEEERYFYKIDFLSYDYELIYSLGTNLGIGDREGLLKLIRAVEVEGLDAISTGVALAWATEAYEKGLVSKDDTLVELRWGDWESYIKAVHHIVNQPTEFYRHLAMGVEEAARKYGGQDFAIAFNKVEPAGYHTGPLYVIGLITGSRHSHLDAGGYSMDQKILKAGKEIPPPEKAMEMVAEEEAWRQILASLVICYFARGIYKPPLVAKALKSLGYGVSEDDIVRLGKKIYCEKQSIKLREGYDPSKVRIPSRITETPTPLGKIDEDYVRKAVSSVRDVIIRFLGE